MGAVRAIAFDFNGTLSHDEPILYTVYRDIFSEHGRPLSESDYFGTLAGLPEDVIIERWLDVSGEELDALVEERIERYLALSEGGQSVPPSVREAVAYAADRVPVAVVSGAFRREIEPVLAAARLDRWVQFIVAADDVERGKPDPEGYMHAVFRFEGDLRPDEVVAFEDTEAGVASAKAAGLYCVAVLGTNSPERLQDADELVEGVEIGVVQRLLG